MTQLYFLNYRYKLFSRDQDQCVAFFGFLCSLLLGRYCECFHYVYTPMQYTAIFTDVKKKSFQKKNMNFCFCSKHRLWALVRTTHHWVPTIYVIEQKYENNVFRCTPQFCYIKVGFKGVYLKFLEHQISIF